MEIPDYVQLRIWGTDGYLMGPTEKKRRLSESRESAIVKDSGKQELFYLPDISNFKLLDSAVNIEIPVEYRL